MITTRHVRGLAVAAAFGGLALTASAQSAPGRFRHERPIVIAGPGHYRLAIDVPLLAGAAPFESIRMAGSTPDARRIVAQGGLADLRLFDANNREVPYLLVRPPVDPVWTRGALLPLAVTKKSSGFEVDLGSNQPVDRLRVDGLPAPFLKRLVLEASGDRQRWTLVAPEGTLFDLPDEQLQQVELPFAAGEYRYLRVTWDDTNSGRVPLPRVVTARRVATITSTSSLGAALVVERRPSEPGRSRYTLRLPGSRLPVAAIVLDVSGDHVLRRAEVSEPRLSGGEAAPAALGASVLRRVMRGSLSASNLRIPIEPPAEAQIDLMIDDGDNAPLAINGMTAEFAELPWIYFESDGSPIVARYGSDVRQAPRYDLEAVREGLRIDAAREASWGAARALEPVGAVTPGPLPIEGAAIDAALFRHVRDVAPGDGGLVVLPLDAAVLAGSLGPSRGFADVRIVNATGHQVPYLVERRNEPLALDVRLERLTTMPAAVENTTGRRSVYHLAMPFASLPAARLVLTTDVRVFDRRVSVAVERAADRAHRAPWLDQLAEGRWVHADRDRPTPPLALSIPSTAATGLLVLIDEGDNSALALGPARLLLPSYRLRFYRDKGAKLTLAYGRDDLAAPRYDLALLAPQLLGVSATDVSASDAAPRPEPGPDALSSSWLLYSVLGIAVLVLLGFVVRLMGSAAPPSA